LSDPCPACGLFEPDALLAASEEQWTKENYFQQLALLEKYLSLVPDNIEVLKKRVLLRLILFNRDPSDNQLGKLDMEIVGVLRKEWGWIQGHECRIQLYQIAGDLKILEDDYEKHNLSAAGEDRLVDEKVLKIIHLTRSFKENPAKIDYPNASSEVNARERSGWKWFLLLLISVGVGQFWFNTSSLNKEGDEKILWFACLELALVFLVVITVWMMRSRKKEKPENGKK
jgi:hypothetical protein